MGWGLCGTTVAIGMGVTSMENTLIIHAVLAPIFFSFISFVYFKKFNYTSPLLTALIFLTLIIFMDLALVAPVFEKSFKMFTNIFGLWIPLFLIFISTYLTGLYINKNLDSKS